MSVLKIKKLSENAIVPTRGTPGSAGLDLYACINEDIRINPGECKKITTGIAIEIENKNYGAFVYARSGLAVKYGIAPANCVGVVDSDYRGEITVGLVNRTGIPYKISNGDRIAQMVIMPVEIPEIEVVDDLSDTERGAGGFGSTGKN